jgi:hypothetical protein
MDDKVEELRETVLDDHGSVVEEAHTVLVEKEPDLDAWQRRQFGGTPRQVYRYIGLVLIAGVTLMVISAAWGSWQRHCEREAVAAWQKEQDKRDRATITEWFKAKQERDMK